eukprot:snap_masked-scaffold_31-processed-gene-2.26-mRNA-1 protein AED:1.00 eAED:1.00 QI:0/-1/0/0/-1/1/1/0/433
MIPQLKVLNASVNISSTISQCKSSLQNLQEELRLVSDNGDINQSIQNLIQVEKQSNLVENISAFLLKPKLISSHISQKNYDTALALLSQLKNQTYEKEPFQSLILAETKSLQKSIYENIFHDLKISSSLISTLKLVTSLRKYFSHIDTNRANNSKLTATTFLDARSFSLSLMDLDSSTESMDDYVFFLASSFSHFSTIFSEEKPLLEEFGNRSLKPLVETCEQKIDNLKEYLFQEFCTHFLFLFQKLSNVSSQLSRYGFDFFPIILPRLLLLLTEKIELEFQNVAKEFSFSVKSIKADESNKDKSLLALKGLINEDVDDLLEYKELCQLYNSFVRVLNTLREVLVKGLDLWLVDFLQKKWFVSLLSATAEDPDLSQSLESIFFPLAIKCVHELFGKQIVKEDHTEVDIFSKSDNDFPTDEFPTQEEEPILDLS